MSAESDLGVSKLVDLFNDGTEYHAWRRGRGPRQRQPRPPSCWHPNAVQSMARRPARRQGHVPNILPRLGLYARTHSVSYKCSGVG